MSTTSQEFESYLTVSDTLPDNWEETNPILVEQLKKIADAVNVRSIGWLLDEEYLSGEQFIPGANQPQDFRSVLKKVIDCGPLSIGANNFAHGITFDSNFTLLGLYASATNSSTLVAEPIPNSADTLSMNATNVIITVAAEWTRCVAVISYIQEI